VVTIAEVAEHAGVAPSTVSYVLSGKRSISPKTRRRVEDSIRVLNYHPHAGARALASQRSNVIALVVPLRPGMHVPVLMQFAISVVTTARRFDQDVLLLTADEGPAGLRRVAASALVDALIVMDVELHDTRLPELRTLHQPSVLIGIPADTAGLTCIDLDFAAAGALCVDHLADLGHRSIGLIGPPTAVYERETGFATRTISGFDQAVKRRGIHATTHPCEPTYEAVRRTLDGVFRSQPELTGLVVHNEAVISPLLDSLHQLGRRVPDDVSIVAICPADVAERAVPPLSSVLIPAEEVGRLAVELVMDSLEGRQNRQTTLLAPRLTRRQSAATATAHADPADAAARAR
jgi:DNA-binding LacI/PurR family transcriptional regulator